MIRIRFALTVALLAICAVAVPQAPTVSSIRGRVVDGAGMPVPNAQVTLKSPSDEITSYTDSAGRFFIPIDSTLPVAITINSEGMQPTSVSINPAQYSADVQIVMQPKTIEQKVNVTTTRASVEVGPTANTVYTLSASDLSQYPALTLDERLRQHAGFELFRRSSGWVANPTSEGISLRGLGSTAASRTLVLADSVPLNDPFGGWIHWNELPPLAVDAVTIATGGGSDLYGSSAVGGVIDLVPGRPGPLLAEADLAQASENTTPLSARVDGRQSHWGELVAGESFRTDGYIVVAPQVRGPVDIPSNVHFQTGRFELDRALPANARAFVLGNVLNEARSNGTPLQTNGTRLWRYVAGDDWSAGSRTNGRVRAFGSDEAYRQSFSSINATRSSETLTRLQRVETQEFGASADGSFHLNHTAFIAGGDLRDIRATDLETPIAAGQPSGLQDTSARQRFYGGFGEILAERGRWSGAASLRADEAENLDTHAITQASNNPQTEARLADRHELIFSPRLGLVRQFPSHLTVHASGFRAFRAPSMNELYRTGQVGQQLTLANSSLVSERATGAEAGAVWSSPVRNFALQGTYFWTEINRPISAVLISSTPTSITNLRENLGQIQSQGTEISAQFDPLPALTASFGYQYAHAIVTSFQAQPSLVGLWIPEVPRNAATAQLRYRAGHATNITLAARESGRVFDDSSNIYELHGFFVLNGYAETNFRRNYSAYISLQNILDRRIETARTPYLTLGTPFLIQGGIKLQWGGH
jgi:outer membrane receptor protein involved in Fe transport